MKRIFAFAIAFSLTGLTSAFAHGTGSHILGTVAAIAADRITVRAEDGDMVPVTVNEATTYRSGEHEATLADIVVGARIVIDVGSEPGSTTAKSVRVAAAQGAKPDAKKNACDSADDAAGRSACGGGAAAGAPGQREDDHAH